MRPPISILPDGNVPRPTCCWCRATALLPMLIVLLLGPAAAAGSKSGGVTKDGVSVYYVVIPASTLRQSSQDQLNPAGSIPENPDAHHLMVVLFSASTLERIEAAKITAIMTDMIGPDERKQLTPHTMGGFLMYGNYFSMPARVGYRVRLELTLPKTQREIRITFDVELE